MSTPNAPAIQAIDYIELATRDMARNAKLLQDFGFEVHEPQGVPPSDSGNSDGGESLFFTQGNARFLLTSGMQKGDAFVAKHGEGFSRIALRVEDAEEAHGAVVDRGAQSVRTPYKEIVGNTEITRAEVVAFGDVVHELISRRGVSNGSGGVGSEAVLPGYGHVPMFTEPKNGLTLPDHITCNFGAGELEPMESQQEKVWGFKAVKFFHIITGKTGLRSYVMRNSNGAVTMPFNEPTEEASQIQEFINTYKGPGVQHIALLSKDIISSLDHILENKINFLSVPDSYYEEIPNRVPDMTEDLNEIKKRGILADGDETGYLLQIFTDPVVGPFFFEVIQRKGNQGFGEGNFQALFEAMERDQVDRGAL